VVDYYKTLELNINSSSSDIKRSFRKKAKELHPDLKVDSHQKNSSEEMMLLIKAYKVLSDPEKRSDYDHKYQTQVKKSEFDYREFLKSEKENYSYQSRLIFYDLINSHPDEALDLYEDMLTQESYDMEKYLNRSDYLECIFLLAEEFEKRGEYIRAFEFLKKLYNHELATPYFKHFIEEITERMKNMVCFKMIPITPPDLTIKHLNELVGFNFSNKDNAFFYKKMAELSLKNGNKADAINYLKKGLKYNKNLAGIKKLRERIGI